MSKTILIYNVPDAVHRTLKVRAAIARVSLSDFLLNELQEIAALRTMHELREQLQRRDSIRQDVSAARGRATRRGDD